MQELYQVKGTVNNGFVGQITYTVCLPDTMKDLDIRLTFEKQHFPSMKEVPEEELLAYCKEQYGMEPSSEEEKEHALLKDTKTEIHLLATVNDEFLGCIHRQLTDRHMIISPDTLTEGCVYPGPLKGVLKVTVLVFQVLMDDTPYTVTVSGTPDTDTQTKEEHKNGATV